MPPVSERTARAAVPIVKMNNTTRAATEPEDRRLERPLLIAGIFGAARLLCTTRSASSCRAAPIRAVYQASSVLLVTELSDSWSPAAAQCIGSRPSTSRQSRPQAIQLF